MNIYLEAFGIFFKIGAFTIGGGYAMVPLIENEIVGSRESLLSCPRILICIPLVTELVLPSGSKATFHPRILRFPSSLRKTLSERAVYVLLFFLAFVHVNHSEGRRICQEMTVDFVPVKLMRKYY